MKAARPDVTRKLPPYSELYHRFGGSVSAPLDRIEERVRRDKRGSPVKVTDEAFAQDAEARADREMFSALYDGEIRSVDTDLGRIFTLVKEQGRYPEAVIAVTGDHGELLYERGWMGHGGYSLYPEAWLSPLIIKAPLARKGGDSNAPSASVDIPATLLRLSDLPIPPTFQGTDLFPALQGEKMPPRPLVCDDGTHGAVMLKEGDLALVVAGSRAEELYRFPKDPRWENNLASEQQEEVSRMRTRLAGLFADRAWGGVVVLTGGPEEVRYEVTVRQLAPSERVWAWSGGGRRGGALRQTPGEASWTVRLGAGEGAVMVVEGGLPPSGSLLIQRNGVAVGEEESRVMAWDPQRFLAEGQVQVFQRGPRGGSSAAETGGETMEQLRALGYIQ